jgi:hypothetical protein
MHSIGCNIPCTQFVWVLHRVGSSISLLPYAHMFYLLVIMCHSKFLVMGSMTRDFEQVHPVAETGEADFLEQASQYAPLLYPGSELKNN